MVAFSSLLLAVTGAVSIPGAPVSKASTSLDKRTDPGTGNNNGFYYSFYNAGGGTVAYTNGAGGSYTTDWTDCNNFVAGKGWSPGSAR